MNKVRKNNNKLKSNMLVKLYNYLMCFSSKVTHTVDMSIMSKRGKNNINIA